MGLVGLNSKPCESESPAQFNSQKHTCEHFCEVSYSEYIPAGSRPLASWGQRACPSYGLPVTWDKSPPARTSGVHWGWREGWRKAAQRSPVKRREGGIRTGNRYGWFHIQCLSFVIFSISCMETCCMYVPLVCCILCKSERMLCQSMTVVCKIVANKSSDCRAVENRPELCVAGLWLSSLD